MGESRGHAWGSERVLSVYLKEMTVSATGLDVGLGDGKSQG